MHRFESDDDEDDPMENKVRLVEMLLDKCRKLVGSFKHSYLLTRKLFDTQIALRTSRTKLIQDVPTSWNSTYQMMASILENRLNFVQLRADNEINNKVKDNFLDNSDYDLLTDLVELLEPLYELTEMLSGSKYETCSLVFPVYLI